MAQRWGSWGEPAYQLGAAASGVPPPPAGMSHYEREWRAARGELPHTTSAGGIASRYSTPSTAGRSAANTPRGAAPAAVAPLSTSFSDSLGQLRGASFEEKAQHLLAWQPTAATPMSQVSVPFEYQRPGAWRDAGRSTQGHAEAMPAAVHGVLSQQQQRVPPAAGGVCSPTTTPNRVSGLLNRSDVSLMSEAGAAVGGWVGPGAGGYYDPSGSVSATTTPRMCLSDEIDRALSIHAMAEECRANGPAAEGAAPAGPAGITLEQQQQQQHLYFPLATTPSAAAAPISLSAATLPAGTPMSIPARLKMYMTHGEGGRGVEATQDGHPQPRHIQLERGLPNHQHLGGPRAGYGGGGASQVVGDSATGGAADYSFLTVDAQIRKSNIPAIPHADGGSHGRPSGSDLCNPREYSAATRAGGGVFATPTSTSATSICARTGALHGDVMDALHGRTLQLSPTPTPVFTASTPKLAGAGGGRGVSQHTTHATPTAAHHTADTAGGMTYVRSPKRVIPTAGSAASAMPYAVANAIASSAMSPRAAAIAAAAVAGYMNPSSTDAKPLPTSPPPPPIRSPVRRTAAAATSPPRAASRNTRGSLSQPPSAHGHARFWDGLSGFVGVRAGDAERGGAAPTQDTVDSAQSTACPAVVSPARVHPTSAGRAAALPARTPTPTHGHAEASTPLARCSEPSASPPTRPPPPETLSSPGAAGDHERKDPIAADGASNDDRLPAPAPTSHASSSPITEHSVDLLRAASVSVPVSLVARADGAGDGVSVAPPCSIPSAPQSPWVGATEVPAVPPPPSDVSASIPRRYGGAHDRSDAAVVTEAIITAGSMGNAGEGAHGDNDDNETSISAALLPPVPTPTTTAARAGPLRMASACVALPSAPTSAPTSGAFSGHTVPALGEPAAVDARGLHPLGDAVGSDAKRTSGEVPGAPTAHTPLAAQQHGDDAAGAGCAASPHDMLDAARVGSRTAMRRRDLVSPRSPVSAASVDPRNPVAGGRSLVQSNAHVSSGNDPRDSISIGAATPLPAPLPSPPTRLSIDALPVTHGTPTALLDAAHLLAQELYPPGVGYDATRDALERPPLYEGGGSTPTHRRGTDMPTHLDSTSPHAIIYGYVNVHREGLLAPPAPAPSLMRGLCPADDEVARVPLRPAQETASPRDFLDAARSSGPPRRNLVSPEADPPPMIPAALPSATAMPAALPGGAGNHYSDLDFSAECLISQVLPATASPPPLPIESFSLFGLDATAAGTAAAFPPTLTQGLPVTCNGGQGDLLPLAHAAGAGGLVVPPAPALPACTDAAPVVHMGGVPAHVLAAAARPVLAEQHPNTFGVGVGVGGGTEFLDPLAALTSPGHTLTELPLPPLATTAPPSPAVADVVAGSATLAPARSLVSPRALPTTHPATLRVDVDGPATRASFLERGAPPTACEHSVRSASPASTDATATGRRSCSSSLSVTALTRNVVSPLPPTDDVDAAEGGGVVHDAPSQALVQTQAPRSHHAPVRSVVSPVPPVVTEADAEERGANEPRVQVVSQSSVPQAQVPWAHPQIPPMRAVVSPAPPGSCGTKSEDDNGVSDSVERVDAWSGSSSRGTSRGDNGAQGGAVYAAGMGHILPSGSTSAAQPPRGVVSPTPPQRAGGGADLDVAVCDRSGSAQSYNTATTGDSGSTLAVTRAPSASMLRAAEAEAEALATPEGLFHPAHPTLAHAHPHGPLAVACSDVGAGRGLHVGAVADSVPPTPAPDAGVGHPHIAVDPGTPVIVAAAAVPAAPAASLAVGQVDAPPGPAVSLVPTVADPLLLAEAAEDASRPSTPPDREILGFAPAATPSPEVRHSIITANVGMYSAAGLRGVSVHTATPGEAAAALATVSPAPPRAPRGGDHGYEHGRSNGNGPSGVVGPCVVAHPHAPTPPHASRVAFGGVGVVLSPDFGFPADVSPPACSPPASPEDDDGGVDDVATAATTDTRSRSADPCPHRHEAESLDVHRKLYSTTSSAGTAAVGLMEMVAPACFVSIDGDVVGGGEADAAGGPGVDGAWRGEEEEGGDAASAATADAVVSLVSHESAVGGGDATADDDDGASPAPRPAGQGHGVAVAPGPVRVRSVGLLHIPPPPTVSLGGTQSDATPAAAADNHSIIDTTSGVGPSASVRSAGSSVLPCASHTATGAAADEHQDIAAALPGDGEADADIDHSLRLVACPLSDNSVGGSAVNSFVAAPGDVGLATVQVVPQAARALPLAARDASPSVERTPLVIDATASTSGFGLLVPPTSPASIPTGLGTLASAVGAALCESTAAVVENDACEDGGAGALGEAVSHASAASADDELVGGYHAGGDVSNAEYLSTVLKRSMRGRPQEHILGDAAAAAPASATPSSVDGLGVRAVASVDIDSCDNWGREVTAPVSAIDAAAPVRPGLFVQEAQLCMRAGTPTPPPAHVPTHSGALSPPRTGLVREASCDHGGLHTQASTMVSLLSMSMQLSSQSTVTPVPPDVPPAIAFQTAPSVDWGAVPRSAGRRYSDATHDGARRRSIPSMPSHVESASGVWEHAAPPASSVSASHIQLVSPRAPSAPTPALPAPVAQEPTQHAVDTPPSTGVHSRGSSPHTPTAATTEGSESEADRAAAYPVPPGIGEPLSLTAGASMSTDCTGSSDAEGAEVAAADMGGRARNPFLQQSPTEWRLHRQPHAADSARHRPHAEPQEDTPVEAAALEASPQVQLFSSLQLPTPMVRASHADIPEDNAQLGVADEPAEADTAGGPGPAADGDDANAYDAGADAGEGGADDDAPPVALPDSFNTVTEDMRQLMQLMHSVESVADSHDTNAANSSMHTTGSPPERTRQDTDPSTRPPAAPPAPPALDACDGGTSSSSMPSPAPHAAAECPVHPTRSDLDGSVYSSIRWARSVTSRTAAGSEPLDASGCLSGRSGAHSEAGDVSNLLLSSIEVSRSVMIPPRHAVDAAPQPPAPEPRPAAPRDPMLPPPSPSAAAARRHGAPQELSRRNTDALLPHIARVVSMTVSSHPSVPSPSPQLQSSAGSVPSDDAPMPVGATRPPQSPPRITAHRADSNTVFADVVRSVSITLDASASSMRTPQAVGRRGLLKRWKSGGRENTATSMATTATSIASDTQLPPSPALPRARQGVTRTPGTPMQQSTTMTTTSDAGEMSVSAGGAQSGVKSWKQARTPRGRVRGRAGTPRTSLSSLSCVGSEGTPSEGRDALFPSVDAQLRPLESSGAATAGDTRSSERNASLAAISETAAAVSQALVEMAAAGDPRGLGRSPSPRARLASMAQELDAAVAAVRRESAARGSSLSPAAQAAGDSPHAQTFTKIAREVSDLIETTPVQTDMEVGEGYAPTSPPTFTKIAREVSDLIEKLQQSTDSVDTS